MVKIYSKNGCAQCRMTKKVMQAIGVDYQEINVDNHPEYVDGLKKRGFKAMPIIDTGKEVWTGFKPDKIKGLI